MSLVLPLLWQIDTRNPSPEIITINSLVAQWCQCLRQGQQRRTEEEISVGVDNQRHQTSSCYFVSYTDCDYCPPNTFYCLNFYYLSTEQCPVVYTASVSIFFQPFKNLKYFYKLLIACIVFSISKVKSKEIYFYVKNQRIGLGVQKKI